MGLRYDYSKGFYPSFPMLGPLGEMTGVMSPPNDDVYHFSVISPRVGVNVKLTEQTVVKGHYGRYYSAIERDFSAIVPSTTPEYTYDIDASGNRSNFTSQTPANLRVDPDRKNPVLRSVHRAGRTGTREEPRPAGELRLQARRRLRRMAGHRGTVRAGSVRGQRGHRRERRHVHALPPRLGAKRSHLPADDAWRARTRGTTARRSC